MKNKINEFEKHCQLEEMKLRGTYLMMAVDADFILSMIIVGIYRGDPNEIKTFFKKSKDKYKNLHEFDMAEKIDVCKRGLNKYYQKFYTSYKEEIDKLDILRDDRNKFAHQKIDFYPEDLNKIVLSKLVNKLKVERTEYSLKELWQELRKHHEAISKILDVLMQFVNPLPLKS